MYMPYFYDPTYILVLIGVVISMAASGMVKSAFSRYSQVRSASGMTGAQTAERILRQAGINDVRVNHVAGTLTDHYDPSSRTVNLSDSVYGSASVAAVGVAAHECGHALQHATGYAPLSIRSAIVPAANFGSMAGIPICVVGALLGGIGRYASGGIGSLLVQVGIWLFSLSVIFQIVTLPVEFNASHRALQKLEEYSILGDQELKYTKKVLSAAALTYVAAAAASILQLLRIILIFGGNRRSD